MKRILITGATGQLGRALNKVFAESQDVTIYNTDICEQDDDLLGKVHEMNIADENQVFNIVETVRPDVIVNCAAFTAVDLCETEQEKAYKINSEGPQNLAKAAQKIGAKMFQISTDYIFDGLSDVPYTEENEGNPQSVYAKTKYEAEKKVSELCTRSFVIRTAWMYGEGKNFVNTMLRLAETNKEIRVVDDQHGTPTSANEVARMIAFLMNTENYGLYHGTCEGNTTWCGFAKEIFRLAKKEVAVIPIKTNEYPVAAKRPAYSVLENKKLNTETDFRFEEWHNELKKYVESYKL